MVSVFRCDGKTLSKDVLGKAKQSRTRALARESDQHDARPPRDFLD